MVKIGVSLLGALALAVAMTAGPALADDNGIAGSIHDLRREKGRLCQDGHYHTVSGSGSSKKAALADAIASWSSFTTFEYGTDWGRFSKAASKSMSCSPGSGTWNCTVEARPCK